MGAQSRRNRSGSEHVHFRVGDDGEVHGGEGEDVGDGGGATDGGKGGTCVVVLGVG